MTEDKIKEQQPAAQPVRQPRRQKLRSLWAQFQCRGVLRRHRIRRKRQHRWEKLWHKLLHNPIAPMVGETLYAIGFSAEYAGASALDAACSMGCGVCCKRSENC
ncbi:MAG: hypothetical protein ACLVJH_11045 [Faecalibacterium prausnitzii]